ncbi:molybdopterin cofactor-binding domain-containing protein [Caballeronia temeraria]|uniref:molybdopterin cofactor-binding domain-containing protein n=1 Tax=Caballeronia temeraria TaxID=1777137 RepID=UPI001FC95379|nr:molybdopterin cofactor-binding domain-containing protein [Caballeronia temeraria]
MPTWLVCGTRVRVDRRTGVVTVGRLTFVIDAGTIIDPESARAQIEGGALWGLSMALYEGTAFKKRAGAGHNLDSYTPLRIGDVPDMDISFVDSTEVPVGLGEPATTVVGPAIANAISSRWELAFAIFQSRRKQCVSASGTRGEPRQRPRSALPSSHSTSAG